MAMQPGMIQTAEGEIELNAGRPKQILAISP